MARPDIKIKLGTIDIFTEILGICAILILVGLPLYYYGELPDRIPSHYGPDGKPDDYSGKGILWLLPVIGVILFLGMQILNRYPRSFNYPKKITEDNARHMYGMATKMIRMMNTVIACAFAYIMYATIQTALGNQEGLNSYFTLTFLVVILGMSGYFLYRSVRKE